MSRLSFFIKKSFWKRILQALGLYFAITILVLFGLRFYTHHGKSNPVPDFKGLSQERVTQLAEYNNLRIEIVDSTFIPYLKKGSVIEQNPAPGVNVKRNRTIFLTINAFNQAKVKMPNVVGVTFRQGKSTLESRGLNVGQLIYVADFAENNILKQMFNGEKIEKGSMIEKGQSIDLVLGNGLGQSSYPVPNLEKLTYNRAVNEINDSYFNVGSVTFDESVLNYNDTINALVWKQRPAYGKYSRAVMGAKVDLWLSIDKSKFQDEN